MATQRPSPWHPAINGGSFTEYLATGMVDDQWQGGAIGVYRANDQASTNLEWDDFKAGFDANNNGNVDDSGDRIYANYDFASSALTITHDDNGNLVSDGLFQRKYDAWNRLVGVYYASGDAGDSTEAVASFEYDGLFRRTIAEYGNRGYGLLYGTNVGVEGLDGGDRTEEYFYSGWRMVEIHDKSGAALGQYVYGTQYIDEPICYDRNTDPSADSNCLESGGSAQYFMHQDANYRVVALTDEAGIAVERYEYSAYGEPTISSGAWDGGTLELGLPLLASATGNRLMHQGLWRDGDIGEYQSRNRQYLSALGRFATRDPLGPLDGPNLYEFARSSPIDLLDPFGLCSWGERFAGICAEADHAREQASKRAEEARKRGNEKMDKIAEEAEADAERDLSEEAQSAAADGVQNTLDTAGMIPGLGEVADGASDIVSLARGDKTGFWLSVASMCPAGGQAAGATKIARRAAAAAAGAGGVVVTATKKESKGPRYEIRSFRWRSSAPD